MNQYKKYKADSDNIIPITDEAYFGDDIVERFKKFLEVAFSRDTINDNINYIADVLGKKGTETSEERIRRYFNDEFFDEHIKMYQKNPILTPHVSETSDCAWAEDTLSELLQSTLK